MLFPFGCHYIFIARLFFGHDRIIVFFAAIRFIVLEKKGSIFSKQEGIFPRTGNGAKIERAFFFASGQRALFDRSVFLVLQIVTTMRTLRFPFYAKS